MEEKEIQTNESIEGGVAAEPADPAQIISDLKKNSVPKEEFDKLNASYRKTLQMLANGEKMEEEVVDHKKTIEECKKNLIREDISNREYWENALALRDAVIASGGRDPFLATNPAEGDKPSDFETAERVASCFRKALEDANGNDAYFDYACSEMINEVNLPKKTRR